MTQRKRHRIGGLAAAAVLLAVGSLFGPVAAPALAAPRPGADPGIDLPAPVPAKGVDAVPSSERPGLLGSGSDTSGDVALATSGDADGFHVLVADARDGYRWRVAATLSEPGWEADAWIGNVCVTGSGRRAVVVYAPRTFTNKAQLFDRGGFTAVVDLGTGTVTKLPVLTTLAYFNPSCGAGEDALLTQAGDEDLGRTRLIRLDAAAHRLGGRVEVPGQLTSAVPTGNGQIVAADAGALVTVGADGTRRVLARTAGVPFKLAADADGGVSYLERSGADRAAAKRVQLASRRVASLANGPLTQLDISSGLGGQVYVTGSGTPSGTGSTAHVRVVRAPVGSRISSRGRLAVSSVVHSDQADPRTPTARAGAARPVSIGATSLPTGRQVTFAADPADASGPAGTARSAAAIASGRAASPALVSARGPAAGPAASAVAVTPLASPNGPADLADRYCSVPRNDPANQAMQPKPRQVEWAVDQAVRGVLTVSRPANWKNLGMPAYTPQGLFPSLALAGGGYVPAQIMLGVAAQESNLWEAARFAVPGVTANPLIGNYYGLPLYNSTEADDWDINWANADCGYGVTQVTDGMRLAGHEKPGETAMPYQTQRAVALDFAANVAAGVRILQSKWNETRTAGLMINNGDSSKIENWFYAVWAYNSGYHADAHDGSPWGVGWGNNPANPHYPANRMPFLDGPTGQGQYSDAAHPQDWPYPEKVIGWAGHPVEVLEAPDTLVSGFRPAWWNGDAITGPLNRAAAEPPHNQFCDASNNCVYGASYTPNAPDVIGEPAGPCAHTDSAGRYDLRCWYHVPSTWKSDCSYSCGNELLRFDPGYAYQADGTAYPPSCDLSGLPSNAQVIDDVPDGTPSIRPDCGRPWTNAGSFTLSYPDDGTGHYPGKIDTHQLGAGFGGHFWFTHTRATPAKLYVTGTWQFSQRQTGFARLIVALPDHGAQATQARYVVTTKHGSRISVVGQPGTGNRWVNLGVFEFDNAPTVTLSNYSPTGDGTQDIAFDAMALVPLSQLTTLPILDWNVAGAAKNGGDYDVMKKVLDEVAVRNPQIITLNEICERQYDWLVARLKENGYAMDGRFQITKPVTTCGLSMDPTLAAGNAVLVRGTVLSEESYAFDSYNNLQEADPASIGSDRGVVCVTTRFASTDNDTEVCSTHLAQDSAVAQQQIPAIAAKFGPKARTMPLIITGDLNTRTPPDNAALATMYGAPAGQGDFAEVDQDRGCITADPCTPTQGGTSTQIGDPTVDKDGRKIDYVFASRWFFFVPVDNVQVIRDVGPCGSDAHACSDHWLFRSAVRLPRA